MGGGLLRLERDGAERVGGAAIDWLPQLEAIFAALPPQAGVRLRSVSALSSLLSPAGPPGNLIASRLGGERRAVRAIAFNKTERTNWALRWHQDRTICVRERRDVPGFTGWGVKDGLIHVEPPFGIMQAMLTVRVHLDPVPADNAPLLIAPGSHRLGRLTIREIDRTVERCGTASCLAQAGDVWLMSTPIVHASEKATKPSRRRVLQVDFASGPLPGSLEWYGVG